MKPVVLIPAGEGDADFTYASGFAVETALFIRFDDGDDVLVASPLEIDRARAQSKARQVRGMDKDGFEDAGPYRSWPRLDSVSARALEDPRGVF